MSDIRHVLNAIATAEDSGEAMALATVVSTAGSTYRRAGARLVVFPDGRRVGNISGGCLEQGVDEVAAEVIAGGGPRVVTFDLTADDDAIWGWGLGCNGVIDVLVEPAAGAVEMAAHLRRAADGGETLVVATVLASALPGVAVGSRLTVTQQGSVSGAFGHPAATDATAAAAGDALAAGRSAVVDVGPVPDVARIFLEVLQPPLRLVVCGAGPDAVPLARFATELGWRVAIVDDRPSFLEPDRFPAGTELVAVTRPADAAGASAVDGRTYVVVMTHNYLRDLDYLTAFLGSGVAYLGQLGPRRRLERLLDEIAGQRGRAIEAAEVAALHGPAGLDIGAETPEEIAWSIVSEILAVHRGRRGGLLSEREGPIHDRPVPTVGG